MRKDGFKFVRKQGFKESCFRAYTAKNMSDDLCPKEHVARQRGVNIFRNKIWQALAGPTHRQVFHSDFPRVGVSGEKRGEPYLSSVPRLFVQAGLPEISISL